MPFTHRDTELYRRDEKLGHKLTPQERIKLLKPYLPEAPGQSQSRKDAKERFGLRRTIRHYLHVIIYTLIHTVFSLWIRIRQAYHSIINVIYSSLHYHHRTPEIIQRDVQGLSKLPKHLSVILTLDNDGSNGADLEKLVNEAAEIAAWSASAGIPMLSIYEKTGLLKNYMPQVHRAISERFGAYFGPNHPGLTLQAPHTPSVESIAPRGAYADGGEPKHLSIMLISVEDGRESLVDLTRTLAEMAQRSKIKPDDVDIHLLNAELSEIVMGEPDLLIIFGPHIELSGYPPWQVRLTEIFHVPDNHGVGYQVFYRALCRFAKAQFRFGY